MLTCKVSMVQFTLCVGGGWFSQSSEKKLLKCRICVHVPNRNQSVSDLYIAVLIFTDELTRSNPHSHVKKSRPGSFCVSCRYVSFSLVMVHLKFIFQPVWSGSSLYFPEFISVFPREQYPHPEQWGISLSVVAHLRGMNPALQKVCSCLTT